MLENLTSKLSNIVSGVIGRYKLSESNIKDILRRVRKSLLEADVSWDVVKLFINNIKSKLLGLEISRKISPGKIFLKVVNDEIISILGGKNVKSDYCFVKKNSLNVILLVGLHGVGKTTSVVKLARYIKHREKKKCLVVSCDIHRPAAMEQLFIFSKKAGIDFYSGDQSNVSIDNILNNVLDYANSFGYDVLIIDSAGRLHIDDVMMSEVRLISSISRPDYVFLVVDSMIGQSVLDSSSDFAKNLSISGFILTKMDSDSRGGVLLSLSYVTKKRIYFLGVGEGVDDFEYFYPERIASRILGMGDISGLLDDVNRKLGSRDMVRLSERVEDNTWNLNDLKDQFKHMIKFGGIKNIMSKMPGVSLLSDAVKKKVDDRSFIDMLAVIDSMTHKERKFPNLINGSRKKRIALGSGTNIRIINKLLKHYEKMKRVLGKKNKREDMYSSFKDKIN